MSYPTPSRVALSGSGVVDEEDERAALIPNEDGLADKPFLARSDSNRGSRSLSGLSWLGRIPFRVLRAVGINTTRLEGTGVGAAIGLVTTLVTLAAALLAISNQIR